LLGKATIPEGRRWRDKSLFSAGETKSSSSEPFEFQERTFRPKAGSHWSTTKAGLERLKTQNRIVLFKDRLNFKSYLDIKPLKFPPLPKVGKGGFSGDIEYEVILKGVDIYDPLTGEVYSDNGSKIAAWFIDTDYDKRTFCVSQAFFPDSTAWDKLKRALKTSIDEEKFKLLTSSCSLPFKLGKEERIAVKVIDHRGE
jgi:hypothetical protein